MSSTLFKAFRDNLKVKNSDAISTSYANITCRLNKDFWDTESDSTNCLQIGSYGRHTAIHGISDLDMAFELPWSVYEKFKNYEGNGPSALLQEVRSSIKKRYPTTEIKGDGQVVVVNFTGFVVEVLPAFIDEEAGGYRFPDSNNGGSWRICKPRQEMEAVNKRNGETNRNFKHVCKMIRAWKNQHGVAMSGMLIDTLVYNFFTSHTEFNTKSYGSYDELFVKLFAYLAGLEHQDYWAAPGSGQRVHSSGKFQRKAKKAAQKCQEAVDAETDSKKAKLWREVFGYQFPLQVADTITKSIVASEGFQSRSTEEFIENIFPVDVRYDLDIDCEVTGKERTVDLLRRLLGGPFALPTGRSLRFKVESCAVPQPYDVYWKVRNVGPEAERHGIRGQILKDNGQLERFEKTDFRGDHYVEAYVVKNGVCVARDRIPVPIAA